ncbi:class I SAM-dependent methyltransferase [Desulfotalea psychrophila]|uniref:Methyltransferase domain-containing protein n=1 Tax=Desulfotalea psychrophila (strain LSv54 / DSM 12343) TaxID=177439 RepID=Q6APZ1_DESPS|nr:class I SAM-dependent methyltransferase [Desulfotalea psychrophila]CAG35582.1 conserved hypothetical protein [Desulfotalea psychrophila LSv54]
MTKKNSPSCYQDIDWKLLHANACKEKAWKSKKARDWDKKAPSFSKSAKESNYSSLFLSHLPLETGMTVLDIGAGSGTLALPIAKKVQRVTAIDYSQGMLDQLQSEAAAAGIDNIETICCAWQDDWQSKNIVAHDIAIASRSLGVDDLQKALIKLNSYASKYVFLTDRINPTPFDSHAFKIIGRPFHSGPDYIYTLNMLYSMGIHPCVNILEFDSLKKYDSLEAAVQSYQWMFHEMNTREEDLLRDYLRTRIIAQDKNEITVKPATPHRWALIWWSTAHSDL